MRDKHPALYKEANKSKGTVTVAALPSTPSSSRSDVATSGTQEILPSVIKMRQSYSSDSPRAQELNRAVAYYLAKDMQPYYTVERPGIKIWCLR